MSVEYTRPASGPVPGRTLGIVALVVAIFFNVIGLILPPRQPERIAPERIEVLEDQPLEVGRCRH